MLTGQTNMGNALMRFAINYSPQAEQLWQEGRIQVDLFKCPDWPDLIAQVSAIHAVYAHCMLFAGPCEQPKLDLDLLQHWLEATDTLVVNTHLWMTKSHFAPGELITTEAVIERAVRDVELLGERFGNERIVVENVPYPTEGWYSEQLAEIADPTVLSEIVRRTGCGLLLDTAHAIRACEGTGRSSVKAYLNALPVQALRELHIVGILPEPDELGMRHDHFEMTEADWEIAEWVIEQIRRGCWAEPDTLAFEYGGVGERFAWRSDPRVIAEQAPRLYELAKSV